MRIAVGLWGGHQKYREGIRSVGRTSEVWGERQEHEPGRQEYEEGTKNIRKALKNILQCRRYSKAHH